MLPRLFFQHKPIHIAHKNSALLEMVKEMAKKPESNETPENEVMRAVREQRQHAPNTGIGRRHTDDADTESGKKALDWKAAAGIGIGSAALLAALLYSKGDKK